MRAISSIRAWSWVRQTIRLAWRPRTRATSAIDSRVPICDVPSTTIGYPPSSAIPATNEAWVRSVGLSKMIATVCGPASGLRPYGAAFSAAARSSTSACSAAVRSSSRRKCLGAWVLVMRHLYEGGVEQPRPGREEGLGVGIGEHERWRQPDPTRAWRC